MNKYALENWPDDEEVGIRIATVHFKKEPKLGEITLKGFAKTSGHLMMCITDQRHDIARIELDFQAYKGLVHAAALAKSDKEQRHYVQCFDLLHHGLSDLNIPLFYIQEPEVFALHINTMYKSDNVLGKTGIKYFVDNKELFKNALLVIGDDEAMNANFINAFMLETVYASTEEKKIEGKKRFVSYLMERYAATTSEAVVELLIATMEPNDKNGGHYIHHALSKESDCSISLPNNFLEP